MEVLLIRVVPPKSFGPFAGIGRAFVIYRESSAFCPSQSRKQEITVLKKGE